MVGRPSRAASKRTASAAAKEVKEEPVEVKEENGDSLSQKANGSSDGDLSVRVPSGVDLLWMLGSASGSWAPYSAEVCDGLTAAARTGQRTVNLSGNKTTHVVDLLNCTQTQCEAKKGGKKKSEAQPIRCLVRNRANRSEEDEEEGGFYQWEKSSDDSSSDWVTLEPGIAATLNQMMDMSNEVTVSGVKYDLTNMTSDKGTKIRRIKQETLPKFKKTGITGKLTLSVVADEAEEEEPPAAKKSKRAKDVKTEEEEPAADGKKSGKRGAKKSGKASVKKEPDDVEEEAKPVMKSVIKKGQAPVDSECPQASKYHVFCEPKNIWDCMLNQTNIQNNNNKYYLIQLLKSDSGNNYGVWMRWGRVGYSGQNSWTTCGSDLEKAKQVFRKKFEDKTRNAWEERDSFYKVAGKYDLVHMDYSASQDQQDEVDSKKVGKEESSPAQPPPDSKLEKSLQDLISLICDIRTMEASVIEMEYDTKKAPLGKVTTEQIRAGYQALKRILECINKGKTSGAEITQACNDFYTRIPHEFGFRVPPIIRTPEAVKKKIQLLEALSDIQVALKILSDTTDNSIHPIDRSYKQLQIDMKPLPAGDAERKIVEQSIKDTHGITHSQYSMEVVDLFKLDKGAENDKFKDVGNRKLLFHGSRLSNWAGILSQGLRIAPPEAPSTGYMFGKGVYFADMASKSANYCFTNRTNNIGLMMICEVALGNPRRLLDADYYADKLPNGFHSTLGAGKTEPSGMTKVPNTDLEIPSGKPRNTKVENKNGYTLQYNEYIVYDTAQIRMKYLAKIKFNYKY